MSTHGHELAGRRRFRQFHRMLDRALHVAAASETQISLKTNPSDPQDLARRTSWIGQCMSNTLTLQDFETDYWSYKSIMMHVL